MELNEEQQNAVKSWVADGESLSDVQKKLSSEFGISMTYMDVRFLVLDLGADVQDKPEEKKPEISDDISEQPHDGGLRLEVDRITKPGSVVSGTVVFSDGINASWALDQMGRLALDAGDPEYRPSEEDLHQFQEELKSALATRGF